MKTLTRDDTVHGEEYVRKADALAEIDAAVRSERERCASSVKAWNTAITDQIADELLKGDE